MSFLWSLSPKIRKKLPKGHWDSSLSAKMNMHNLLKPGSKIRPSSFSAGGFERCARSVLNFQNRCKMCSALELFVGSRKNQIIEKFRNCFDRYFGGGGGRAFKDAVLRSPPPLAQPKHSTLWQVFSRMSSKKGKGVWMLVWWGKGYPTCQLSPIFVYSWGKKWHPWGNGLARNSPSRAGPGGYGTKLQILATAWHHNSTHKLCAVHGCYFEGGFRDAWADHHLDAVYRGLSSHMPCHPPILVTISNFFQPTISLYDDFNTINRIFVSKIMVFFAVVLLAAWRRQWHSTLFFSHIWEIAKQP